MVSRVPRRILAALPPHHQILQRPAVHVNGTPEATSAAHAQLGAEHDVEGVSHQDHRADDGPRLEQAIDHEACERRAPTSVEYRRQRTHARVLRRRLARRQLCTSAATLLRRCSPT